MKVTRIVAVLGVVALIAVLSITAVSIAFAQSETPSTEATPTTPTAPRLDGWGRGFGIGGDRTAQFDKVAEVLNLTPTQLFEQLHSGKTLTEIAEAQGVELATIQEALNANRIQAAKDAIEQAVEDGKITQEQADWMLEGIEKGYTFGGRGFGFGGGRRGHGMMGGMDGIRGLRGLDGNKTAPAMPESGTSS